MPAKTARREMLRTAYLKAFDDFATDAPEVAEVLGIEPAAATRLFRELERNGLTCGTHVNGSRKLTWQATETYDSLSREEAEARFDAVYPVEPDAKESGRKGTTGPAYTAKQLQAGREARLEGLSWAKVAEKAGVKSESYFSRVLRERFPELAEKPKPAQKAPAKTAAKKPTARKRATKATTARKKVQRTA